MAARILVVDDNPMNRKLAAMTLEYEGYEVVTAVDAESARSLIATEARIELILMDVSLPGMDGITFTRELKADQRTSRIKIIILTASAMGGDRQVAMDAGADGYVSKPFSVTTFPGLIAGHLRW